jgi:hypothetical protein
MPYPSPPHTALKLDIHIFTEVLEPLVEFPTLEQRRLIVDLNDFDSPPPKWLRRNLDCEYVYLASSFIL